MSTWRKSSYSGGTSVHSDCVEVVRMPSVTAEGFGGVSDQNPRR
ncbi:DUF397 domain-containing protein [Actinoallomurus rhizosphaericola]|nr:DUF397 domain-containing protein [Actinoallomurus rhizosphaericola]MCO5993236.1 DUF397 domain-containing protein [Actinoallomurus rhizosphaericola]